MLRKNTLIIVIAASSLALYSLFGSAVCCGQNNKCIDPAGREYLTVKIGNQLWMAENVAYKPPTGNYWAYDNDPKNVAKYGYLYDWETAKNVCPEGWHLPSDDEWTKLTDYLGGKDVAVEKMKSRTGWTGNDNGTDESAFSALPAGIRHNFGEFSRVGNYAIYWSSTSSYWPTGLYYFLGNAGRYEDYAPDNGMSVRCLRD